PPCPTCAGRRCLGGVSENVRLADCTFRFAAHAEISSTAQVVQTTLRAGARRLWALLLAPERMDRTNFGVDIRVGMRALPCRGRPRPAEISPAQRPDRG